MALLITGLLIFLGAHSLRIVAPAWRESVIRARGENAWKGAHALLSLLGLTLIIVGYGMARQSPWTLYTPPAALRHAALLLMAPVFVLLLATYLPGRIAAATKHPTLLAVKLWALSHLLANGTAADVLLFGSFLVWAVADRISVKHRAAPAEARGPGRSRNDAIALVGGLAIYVAFIAGLHRWLIGVSPI